MGAARLVSAENPADGVVVARFNAAMRHDARLSLPGSWTMTPASPRSRAIELTEIALHRAYPEMVVLRYTGGGFEYTLSVAGAQTLLGEPVAPADAALSLTIERPGAVDPTIRLFDSLWGPLGIAQRLLDRRTMDQLVAGRAIAMATSEQLRQRLALGDGAPGRDRRPGLGRA